MFKSKTFLFIVLLIAALAAIKWFFLTEEKSMPMGGPGKPGGGPPLSVEGILVAGSNLDESVVSTGTLLANEEVELRPEISGKVVSIHFNEGGPVSKGAVLVKLDDRDYQAQLTKLRSNLKLMQDKAARQQKLFEIEGISRQEYDEALNQVAALEADIEFTMAQIDKTEIIAPFSGKVGLRNISEGSYVSQNFLIATMQQLDPMKVDFSLPEKYREVAKPGNEITFTTDGDTMLHTATIYAVEPKVDPATRSIRLRARTPNPGNRLVPGSFARVRYNVNRSGDAILIPSQAVIPILKGKKVMVARNGMALSQAIVTGVRKEKEVEVISGLQPGDTVITSGIMQLRDSMKVMVKVFD
jgi:membrane fusion protein (multidrug efflux system)